MRGIKLIKEIFGLIETIGTLCISYIEDFARVVIDSATVKETKHFADGFHEGKWEDDIPYFDENEEVPLNINRDDINKKPIYDGMMEEYDD